MSRLQEIREATAKDPDLQGLIDTIQSVWPDEKCSVKDSCKPYFRICDNLSVYEGIVVKEESIVIPKSERQDIKENYTVHTMDMTRCRGEPEDLSIGQE